MPSKSSPQTQRRSLSDDPLAAAMRPPEDESPAQRELRILTEQQAKQISDAIDEQIRLDKAELKKNKPDVQVLLLGQSESGKSTTLKQFQLMHTPAAFHAERVAWRSVIYLNLVRSIRRILDAISPQQDLDPVDLERIDTLSIASDPSSEPSDPQVHREAEEKHAYYLQRLGPLLELEDRLIRALSEDGEDDEATRLGDGSTPGWSVPRPSLQVDTRSITVTSSVRSPIARGVELSVRTTSNWKKALSLNRNKLKTSTSNELEGWWEDPTDPVHVLGDCRAAMEQLWTDSWVRARLAHKLIRLEESSGFYLDEIERITAKKYIPTDDDVLKARLKTMGVVEHTFTIDRGLGRGHFLWKIYDVGGARNQRQAWAPFFQDVTAIIFLAPISAFDQVLAEDSRVNRLEDSLLLWRTVVANKLLARVNIVLFLNKCDLLQAKLEAGVQLKNHLITYGDRPNDYDSVSKYLRNKFGVIHQQNSPTKERELYMHFTSVTDTRRTSKIIASVRDIILRENLKSSRLM
ncbi:G-alpha-domain-containing protein [Artomyces pyxidatus]|uniref:G-alpha-domain-containing protein n=1 Tax=Artomyces pyxidatus TaxID=48021 RepID=A0ACB8SGC2_9AGAM|nr:G-alpha-domain-containing protein [Artomyces pyxidatus]